VARPKDKSMVSSKWIYKIKRAVDGSVEKFKEIFVSRGFNHKEIINYENTFSPVARYTSDQNLDQGSNFSSKINVLRISSKWTRA
jgi:hypothetical protein